MTKREFRQAVECQLAKDDATLTKATLRKLSRQFAELMSLSLSHLPWEDRFNEWDCEWNTEEWSKALHSPLGER